MIKFTDIRRNANVLLKHEKETAIIKHSQVVGYIVPAARMNELLAAEEQYENGYLNGVADSRMDQKRIRVDLDDLDAAQQFYACIGAQIAPYQIVYYVVVRMYIKNLTALLDTKERKIGLYRFFSI